MARTGIDVGDSQLQVGARVKKAASILLLVLLPITFASSLATVDQAQAAKKPNPKSKVAPSPAPKWPPAGFSFESGVYARVPSSKQLVSAISAKRVLASQVKSCTKFVCGAVQVASEPGCLWWEVDSSVYSREKVLLGKLKTIASISSPFEVKTVLLVSPEPIETLEFITDIEVTCHQEPKPSEIKKSTYTKVAEEVKETVIE
jgi:hypothetical protein